MVSSLSASSSFSSSSHATPPTSSSLSASHFNITHHLLKSASARSAAHERATGIEDKTGLSPCYYFDNDTIASVPTVTFHFVGRGFSVVLPRRNYFYDFMDGGGRLSLVGCLMLMSGGDEAEWEGGPVAALGSYQQQGFEVVYDLDKRRVGFGGARLHRRSVARRRSGS